MAKKVLLYNDITEEVITSTADPDGIKFKTYLEKGFKPICLVKPLGNVSVVVESYSLEKYKACLNLKKTIPSN